MKKAFTVAEGLVTLVIVGVLASVMVTSVVKQKPDKNKIMIRNAYAELTGVVNHLVADSMLYPDFAEFGLADDTRVTVRYGGESFVLADNRGKLCVGLRHYFNSITEGYVEDNVEPDIPCRASFYTKNGVKVRFEVNHRNANDFVRFIYMDANPTNDSEILNGVDTDTVQIQISRSGKLTIRNAAARSIISEGQIR
ncbi:hypothetical protein IJC60_06080 [bacterium]|nr:hypothetical protein [bacterium]